MIVIGFAWNARGCGLRVDEFQFADERSTPGLIDASAKFVLHRLQLLLPGFAAGGEFEEAILAAHRLRVGSERLTDDRRPGAFEPRERGFGSIEAAKGFAEKVAGAFHESRILAWAGIGDASAKTAAMKAKANCVLAIENRFQIFGLHSETVRIEADVECNLPGSDVR